MSKVEKYLLKDLETDEAQIFCKKALIRFADNEFYTNDPDGEFYIKIKTIEEAIKYLHDQNYDVVKIDKETIKDTLVVMLMREFRNLMGTVGVKNIDINESNFMSGDTKHVITYTIVVKHDDSREKYSLDREISAVDFYDLYKKSIKGE